MPRLNRGQPLKLQALSLHRAHGIRGVAVKCLDITKNSDREGIVPGQHWRWGSKVRVSNRIRYPGSPHGKRWMLAMGDTMSVAKRKR